MINNYPAYIQSDKFQTFAEGNSFENASNRLENWQLKLLRLTQHQLIKCFLKSE